MNSKPYSCADRMHFKPATANQVAGAAVYSDAFLNHWADVYVERSIREYGVQLEFFLIAPQQILDWIAAGKLKPLHELVGADGVSLVRQFISRRAVDRALHTAHPLAHR